MKLQGTVEDNVTFNTCKIDATSYLILRNCNEFIECDNVLEQTRAYPFKNNTQNNYPHPLGKDLLLLFH